MPLSELEFKVIHYRFMFSNSMSLNPQNRINANIDQTLNKQFNMLQMMHVHNYLLVL